MAAVKTKETAVLKLYATLDKVSFQNANRRQRERVRDPQAYVASV